MRFDAQAKTAAFVRAMESLGVQARAYASNDPNSEPYLVIVTTGEPVRTPGFERRDEQIRDAARQTGGFYVGFGGGAPPDAVLTDL